MINLLTVSDSLVVLYNITCVALIIFLAYECHFKGKEIEYWKGEYEDLKRRFDYAVRDYLESSFDGMKHE